MAVTFPLQPRIEFFDETGRRIVLTAPVLHRFLSDLFDRTGGDVNSVDELFLRELSSEAGVSALESRIGKIKNEIQALALDDVVMQRLISLASEVRSLALKVEMLSDPPSQDVNLKDFSMQVAMMTEPAKHDDIGGYVWAEVL